ncbi:nitrogen regulatory protein P-II [Geomicrobium sp. JCM 19037]|uniref:P-II family nitrogen regulator n=1 Tax=Geomicrobium sp. JCM 19037 TaxID=1460634 RepID=UPI00045F2849|nr:P-II family nitrogen regulator [Geomicrobium sp. JCM 19037]GAK05039.1 nitrogen regulatory protein P-II [Geomicrobium sp. JCM 19037]
MKKIEAIIRPEHFQKLRVGLEEVGISGLTVSEVAGCGKQKGQKGVFRGNAFEVTLLPKVKVEMIIAEEQVEEIIDLISESSFTGDVGDGKIFVYEVVEAVRIRTKERGEKAIS